MQQVLLSVGSNMGNARAAVERALEALERDVFVTCTRSSLWLTEPVGYRDQNSFVNAAIVGSTTLDAEQVHTACKNLEVTLGRTQRERWREREIDIDVILANSTIIREAHLEIPHPRFAERMFVLVPANEIAPTMLCPLRHTTIAELLQLCTDTSAVTLAP